MTAQHLSFLQEALVNKSKWNRRLGSIQKQFPSPRAAGSGVCHDWQHRSFLYIAEGLRCLNHTWFCDTSWPQNAQFSNLIFKMKFRCLAYKSFPTLTLRLGFAQGSGYSKAAASSRCSFLSFLLILSLFLYRLPCHCNWITPESSRVNMCVDTIFVWMCMQMCVEVVQPQLLLLICLNSGVYMCVCVHVLQDGTLFLTCCKEGHSFIPGCSDHEITT